MDGGVVMSNPLGLPDNVRALKPANQEVTVGDIVTMLTEIREAQARIEHDIAEVKGISNLVMENVKPTLDMLTNGPIGQILGIAPPPPPRIGRRHR